MNQTSLNVLFLTKLFFLPSRTKENGFERDPLHPEHPSKRPCTISPGQRFSPSNGLSYQPNGLPHPTPPPPQHYRLDDMAVAHHYRDSYRHPNHREIRDRPRPLGKRAMFMKISCSISCNLHSCGHLLRELMSWKTSNEGAFNKLSAKMWNLNEKDLLTGNWDATILTHAV